MTYLIDTCVLSECVKKIPSPTINRWFNQQQPERYKKLQGWLHTIEIKFYLRILPINDNILTRWAKLSAYAELQGKKLAVMDGLIAATALESNLKLVTRNTSDFEYTGVEIINPWNL